MSLQQNIADAVAGAIAEAEQRETARYLIEEAKFVEQRKAVAAEFEGVQTDLTALDRPLEGSKERLKSFSGQFEHLSSVQGFWSDVPLAKQIQQTGQVWIVASLLIGLAILSRIGRG